MTTKPSPARLSVNRSAMSADAWTGAGTVSTGQALELRVPKRIQDGLAAAAMELKPGRIAALDFTKGTLVLVMVLYHWLNYFVGPQGEFYRYLSFLPPSFICITGFLIAQVYLTERRLADHHLWMRLAVRGLKLLGIFLFLNLGIGLLFRRGQGWAAFSENFSVNRLETILVTGNMAGGRTVAFFVLVPIAYVLLLAACLIPLYKKFKPVCHLATLLGMGLIFLLALNNAKSGNLELITIGLLGISLGLFPLAGQLQVRRHAVPVILAYAAYEAAITIWNVPYPFQVTGVLLTLSLIFLTGSAAGETGWLPRVLILLGKYSLLGYIVQIAILQALRMALPVTLGAWVLPASLLSAALLTLTMIELVDRARGRLEFMNRLYRAVFA